MWKLWSTIVVATLIVTTVQAGIPAGRAGVGGPVTYLAIGTSMTVGYQPSGETSNGFVDDLLRTVQAKIPDLSLHNVGCPGETSVSMIRGKHSECHYAAGSQLNAAVAFLQGHPGQVAFITLEVGANDVVDRCLNPDTGRIDRACTVDLLPRLQTRLTRIVGAVRTAAGPDVPIVAMNYYDPFLGVWGLIPGGRAVARADQRVWTMLNDVFTTAYTDAGVTVADVAATFRIDDFTDTLVVPGRGELPANVANTCTWTWFCSAKFFSDPHPNRTGYRKIAHTFDGALEGLLP